MALFRPFAITQTPLSPPSGTTVIGNIGIGVDEHDYYNNYGSLQWIAGPDESIGIIIAYHDETNPLHAHSSTPGNLYNIGFLRAANEDEFKTLAETLAGQSFASTNAAKTWLTSNGYWTSYGETPWAYGNTHAPISDWYFYSDEGPFNTNPPIDNGNAIFIDGVLGVGGIETYNPNQLPNRYLLFNRFDSNNNDFEQDFTTLAANGGTIILTQVIGLNTETATYQGNASGFIYNGTWLSINTEALIQTTSLDGSFVYGEPITITISFN
jgi:hypothetical protein